MKILYISEFSPGSTAPMRMRALERAGHEVVRMDAKPFWPKNSLLFKIVFRILVGPHIRRLNQEILRVAREVKPDCFWADKVMALQPSTLKKLRAMGITTVSYMIDNPFGPRKDPGWRLYMKDIPYFDLHCTQRDVSIPEYKKRGAGDVVKIQTAYEQTIHFPPPAGWSDKNRNREVSFIGTPYDQRAEVLTELAKAGIPLVISGSERSWKRALAPEIFEKVYREGELKDDAYREGVWRSRINISFLTKSNQDEFTQKSFEIAGCGGFLLAERSKGHTDRFVEGEEAVFFDDIEEMKQQILRYLNNEPARERIAAAGCRRAKESGYDNDSQMRLITDRVAAIRGARK
ncbi:glycosyltransferase [Terriglobus sp. 2YAB30_2]|uniref:CgeB family protein n=1 Tax=unclassified Terriglobus TaxID=2628988 RepID=UPI003F9B1B99